MTIENKQDRFDFEVEKFWFDIGEFLLHGIPSHDKRGHSAEIRFRVRPLQLDIIGNIKEKMPEGWYKNRASLVRNILTVGCKATLEYLKRHEDVVKADNFEKIDQLLKEMNRIAKYDRLDELKRDIFTLQQNILAGGQQNKAEIISLLDKLKEEVNREQGSI